MCDEDITTVALLENLAALSNLPLLIAALVNWVRDQTTGDAVDTVAVSVTPDTLLPSARKRAYIVLRGFEWLCY
jgi:hypothetical protein